MTKNESLRYERYGSLGKVFFFTALFIGLFSLYEGAKPEGTPWLWGARLLVFLLASWLSFYFGELPEPMIIVHFLIYGINDFKTIQAVSFLIFIGSIVVYNRFYLKYVRNSKVE